MIYIEVIMNIAIKQPYFAMHTKSMQQSLAMVMETTERLKPPLG